MRQNVPQSLVVKAHQDFELLNELEQKILHGAGGIETLRRHFPMMMRRIIDSVVDTPRTGRRVYEELEKTEKTYIGTRVEIELRAYLGFPKGELDLCIDGVDVDVKHTMGNNWMIPTEAVDKPCILVAADEDSARCYLGLVVARPPYLSGAENRDAKRSISASGFVHIKWLINGEQYPRNFWRNIPKETIDGIFTGKSGNERLGALFTGIQGVPISRDIVEGVAKQKDYMKRLRANGGARDPLAAKGIVLLSGKYDKSLIAQLGLPPCTVDEFISKQLKNESERALARANGFPVP
jgi:hypothetical protein